MLKLATSITLATAITATAGISSGLIWLGTVLFLTVVLSNETLNKGEENGKRKESRDL